MKRVFAIALMAAACLLQAEQKDLIKDGTFKGGKQFWKFHNCALQNGVVVFNNKQPMHTQLWQKVPITLPAGTKLRLEADIEVADPYDATTEKGYQSRISLTYYNSNNKAVWGKNKPGVFTKLFPSEQKKTFVYTSIVPEGVVYAYAMVNTNKPVQLKVHAIRLIVEQ